MFQSGKRAWSQSVLPLQMHFGFEGGVQKLQEIPPLRVVCCKGVPLSYLYWMDQPFPILGVCLLSVSVALIVFFPYAPTVIVAGQEVVGNSFVCMCMKCTFIYIFTGYTVIIMTVSLNHTRVSYG